MLNNKNERLINEKYDPVDSLIKNECTSIIFWGYSIICRGLLRYYGHYLFHHNTIIWDRVKKVDNVSGYEIGYPNMESISIDSKNNGYVILTFTSEANYIECKKVLIDQGFKNIINGKEFLAYLVKSIISKQYDEYISKNKDINFMIDSDNLLICTNDMFDDAGSGLNDNYLVQDLWAAKKIYTDKPTKHYDIGSRVDGFITHLLSFDTNVVMIDIRSLDTYNTKNLTFLKSDATDLEGIDDCSVDSLSALCSLEHFGLGRYGDVVDPDAHITAFNSIQRVLRKGGNLYISVPISKQPALVFNAHRVYTPHLIAQYFGNMDLIEFSYTSKNGLVENVPLDRFEAGFENYGLFHLKKR